MNPCDDHFMAWTGDYDDHDGAIPADGNPYRTVPIHRRVMKCEVCGLEEVEEWTDCDCADPYYLS